MGWEDAVRRAEILQWQPPLVTGCHRDCAGQNLLPTHCQEWSGGSPGPQPPPPPPPPHSPALPSTSYSPDIGLVLVVLAGEVAR